MDNPMETLAKLAAQISKLAVASGLPLIRFAAVPGDEPYLEMIFTLDPDFRPKDENDDLLAGIEEATRLAEQNRKADEAREGLKDLERQLSEGDGIL